MIGSQNRDVFAVIDLSHFRRCKIICNTCSKRWSKLWRPWQTTFSLYTCFKGESKPCRAMIFQSRVTVLTPCSARKGKWRWRFYGISGTAWGQNCDADGSQLKSLWSWCPLIGSQNRDLSLVLFGRSTKRYYTCSKRWSKLWRPWKKTFDLYTCFKRESKPCRAVFVLTISWHTFDPDPYSNQIYVRLMLKPKRNILLALITMIERLLYSISIAINF